MGIPDEIQTFAAAVGPEPDDVIVEMDQRAERTGFPTVGPAVGGWLRQLAGLVNAERIFEFGSGFGYSAYWFCGGMRGGGKIVLTELDADELDDAQTYLGRGGYADRATFEVGDAIEIVDDYDGPFDVALVDNEKHRYVDAYEAIRDKIPIGGIVVADNTIRGPFDFETLYASVIEEGARERKHTDDTHLDAASGIAEYPAHVRADDAFETTLLSLGEGLTISRRVY